MKKLTLCLCLSLAACITPGPVVPGGPPPPKLTPQEQFATAIDLSTCTTEDVLPGVADTVEHLASTDASVLEKVLRGIVGTASAASRAYACTTRALASRRTQAGGEVAAAAQSDRQLVAARAGVCSTGGRCPRAEHGAAFALQHLLDQQLVVLPAGLGLAPPPGPAGGGGEAGGRGGS